MTELTDKLLQNCDYPADDFSKTVRQAFSLGDDQSWAEIRRVCYDFALLLTKKDSSEADEITQITLMKLIRNGADNYDLNKGASPWLKTIVHNTYIDIIRANERKRAVSLDREINKDSESTTFKDWLDNSPDNKYLQKTIREEIMTGAYQTLSSTYKQIIELAHLRGMKYQEIADELKIPLGTVKSRLNSAVKKLRDLIGEERFELMAA